MTRAKSVDAYIAQAPKEMQKKLETIRSIIMHVAPQAVETMSYGMPYYSYKGRLAYFAYAKHHIGLYVMPPVVAQHKKELEGYKTATATVRFPLDKALPQALIRKLVAAGVTNNEMRVASSKRLP